LVFTMVIIILLACNNDDQKPTCLNTFNFPAKIERCDSIVYEKIKNSCIENWDLCELVDSSFNVYSYGNSYDAECDGIVYGELLRYVLGFDNNGNLITEYTLPRSPCFKEFKFPENNNINTEIYREIILTCDRKWVLCNMIDSTMVIKQEKWGYSISCLGYIDFNTNGILDDGLFSFGIGTSPDGRAENSLYTKYQ
jgi:hypothetical protein